MASFVLVQGRRQLVSVIHHGLDNISLARPVHQPRSRERWSWKLQLTVDQLSRVGDARNFDKLARTVSC